MKKLIYFTFLLLFTISLYGQQKTNFRPPMDIPIYLSGNFGELRSDHFHSGIDIKTQGVQGLKVFAVESGYVSRIKVAPGGYGKAVYIAHPNGYTSVYGHLLNYNEKISAYVKQQQYNRKSHAVDLYLKPGVLKISKGELIALSGNTGSSSGPHLHFELRKTSNQHPVNVLEYNFPIKDTISPRFKKAVIYPIGESSQVKDRTNPVILSPSIQNGNYIINNNERIKVFGTIGIGIEIYDYLNSVPNRCGVFTIEMLVDGRRHYLSEMNEFSFSESRFINAHIDYALKKEARINIQRLYKLPYNDLSIYKFMENKGYIEISDTLDHEIQIIVKDSYGNKSNLLFTVKGANVPQKMNLKEDFNGTVLPYNTSSAFSDQNIQLTFPAYCFYEDVNFAFARTSGGNGFFSDVFHIHKENIPVHKKYEMIINPGNIQDSLKEKLCVVKIEDNNELSFAGGIFANGKVSTELRTFGKFALSLDTLAPVIIPLNFFKGKDMSLEPALRFKIEDDLSGIIKYDGYIDGQWILFEYDPKNDLLFYEFDSKVPISKKNHELEIYLIDNKENILEYKTTFYR